jgi:hypothetical protein
VLGTVPPASAAGPPIVVSAWSSSVFSTSARLQAQINPNGLSTTYHFDYLTKAAYDANPEGSKFTGASRVPVSSDANIGSGTNAVTVLQLLSGLKPETTYYYRAVPKNTTTTLGEAHFFTTQSSGGGSILADSRGWEMVTPIDKNGGEAAGSGTIADGGALQAAVGGGSITYGSETSFGEGAGGAPPISQYIATRGSGGWSAANISAPLFSGSYDTERVGAPYQLFSSDLTRGLLLNGAHCRGEGTECAVPNPPLAGTGAPAGYQNYYLRDNASATYTALLGSTNSGFLALEPRNFDLSLAGTSANLDYGVLSTCAKLTADAIEVPLGEGCDPEEQNLYEYGPGAALKLINLRPSESTGTPGAELAAQAAAISGDGARVYFTDLGNDTLYLRVGSQTKFVATEGAFQTASGDGSVAFYTKPDGHLYRYDAVNGSSTDLTPSGGVDGVLGASAAGDYVYYQDAGGLKLWHTTSKTVAAGMEEEADYPPATGTARVSADGTKLLFVSTGELTGYDNTDLKSGEPDTQIFLYDANGAGSLTCVSCNPTNGRPVGGSSIPGAIANGSLEDSIRSYKPRALSDDGKRVFFDSNDALVLTDTDNAPDAYEWEAQGEGSCSRSGGCVSLISGGRGVSGATFIDASGSGDDAFFLTGESLIKDAAGNDLDPGGIDIYDARAGGGFAVPIPPILCEGDACQSLPPEPVDPTLTTLLSGPGNPGVRYPKHRAHCKKGKVRRHGKCVKKHSKKRHKKRHHKRGGGR